MSEYLLNFHFYAGNEVFHLVTGLSKEDAKRITIFSLAKAERLSTLYELIAESIRIGNSQHDGSVTLPSLCSAKGGSTTSEGSSVQDHYKTIILPCIKFPRELPINPNRNHLSSDLFMSVSYSFLFIKFMYPFHTN